MCVTCLKRVIKSLIQKCCVEPRRATGAFLTVGSHASLLSVPLSQQGRLRLREVMSLGQGCPAGEIQSLDFYQVGCGCLACLLTHSPTGGRLVSTEGDFKANRGCANQRFPCHRCRAAAGHSVLGVFQVPVPFECLLDSHTLL